MLRHIQRIRQEATPERLRQLWYAPPLALAMALTMVRMLIVARILSVGAFSEFSKGILVSGSFGMIGCFGLQPLLQRNWPMMLVRGQEKRGLVLAAQANLVAITCAFIGMMLAGLGFSIAGLTPSILLVGFVHGLSQQLFINATIESRSRGRTFEFASQSLLRAFFILAAGVAVAAVTGSALKALASEAAISFVLSLFFFKKSTSYAAIGPLAVYRLALSRFDKIKWTPPLVMMAVSIIGFLQYNIDRWLASDKLNATQFAHYSFACIVLTIAQSLQALINASLYPFIARRFAMHGRRSAYKVSMAISLLILFLGLLTALPAGYIMRYAIELFYPSYVGAVKLLPIFLVVAVMRVSDFWSSFLLIAHHEKLLFALNLSVTAVIVTGFSAFLLLSPGAITMMDAAMMAGALAAATYIISGIAAWIIGMKP